jgi:hypothetical protein
MLFWRCIDAHQLRVCDVQLFILAGCTLMRLAPLAQVLIDAVHACAAGAEVGIEGFGEP